MTWNDFLPLRKVCTTWSQSLTEFPTFGQRLWIFILVNGFGFCLMHVFVSTLNLSTVPKHRGPPEGQPAALRQGTGGAPGEGYRPWGRAARFQGKLQVNPSKTFLDSAYWALSPASFKGLTTLAMPRCDCHFQEKSFILFFSFKFEIFFCVLYLDA